MRNVKLLVVLLVAGLLISCVRTETRLNSNKVDKEREFEIRLQLAVEYLQEDLMDRAIKELKKAEEIDKKSPKIYEVYGLAFQKNNEPGEAESYFKKMLKYDASYSRGRFNYALFLMREQRYEDAAEQFEKVAEDLYYSNRARAFFHLAQCWQKLGNSEKMGPAYQKAVALDNNFAPAFLELAQFKFDNKEYAASDKYLKQYREKVKQSSPKGLLLGIKIARLFEDKDAEVSYVLALKNLYPRSDEYLEYLKEIK